MAVKFIKATDTLELFRTTFNDMCSEDFGDIANLSGAISATNLVDAMNETISIATSTAGWTVADDTSTTQIIGGGDTLTVLGTANQIQSVVSAVDTITFSFPNDVTIPNSITAVGTTNQFGTFQVVGNTIKSTDSSMITCLDSFKASDLQTGTGLLSIDESASIPRFTSSATGKALTFDAVPTFSGDVLFEGATDNNFETTVTVVDPTQDNTITIPDITGTLITTADSGTISTSMLADGAITVDLLGDNSIDESKIADDAVGQDQLKSVVTLQILNSSGGVLKTLYGAGA